MKIRNALLRKTKIINIIFILTLFFPSNTYSYLLQGVFLVGLILSSPEVNHNRFSTHFKLLKMSFILWISISFIYNVVVQTTFYKDSLIKISYISMLILFFPISGNFKIYSNTLIICLSIIVISQIAYILNIPFVVNLINIFYPDDIYSLKSEYLLSNSSNGFLNMRYGGLFRNPNHCGRIVSLLYAIYLIDIKKSKILMNACVLVLFLFSILLTGSRTAFLVVTLLTVFFVHKNIFVRYKGVYFPFFILTLLFALYFGDFRIESRIFDFSELSGGDKHSSLTIKLNFLLDYIDNTLLRQPLDLIFGTFNVDNGENFVLDGNSRIKNFDSEIGYLIFSIGFVGLSLLLWFYRTVYRTTQRNTHMLMILLVWSISSAVLTNMKFSFLFMLVLSLYYQRKNKSKEELYEGRNKIV